MPNILWKCLKYHYDWKSKGNDDVIAKTRNSDIFKNLKQEIENFNERLKQFNAQYEDLKTSTLYGISLIKSKCKDE